MPKTYSSNFDEYVFGKTEFSWKEDYLARFAKEKISQEQCIEIIKANNPKFILRNYLAQNAIKKAEGGDFTEVEKLLGILKSPFSEHKELESYAKESPDWGKKLEISCSS